MDVILSRFRHLKDAAIQLRFFYAQFSEPVPDSVAWGTWQIDFPLPRHLRR